MHNAIHATKSQKVIIPAKYWALNALPFDNEAYIYMQQLKFNFNRFFKFLYLPYESIHSGFHNLIGIVICQKLFYISSIQKE